MVTSQIRSLEFGLKI